MTKNQTFTIAAKLGIEVTTTIKAESYEEAIAEAKKMRADDFVTIPPNCWMDGDIDKIVFICQEE